MDLIFFWLSKLVWMVISPEIVFTILILVGVVLLLAGAVKKAKILFSILALAILVNAFLPLGSLLLAPLEARFPSRPELPDHVDGIICLAGAENTVLSHARGQAELGDSAERYLGFVHLMNTYPEAVPLFAGGTGELFSQELKSVDVARMVFNDLGVDTKRIVFESDSKNTYENAKFSKALVNPKSGETWVLVTTAWHMSRAVGVFRQLGWEVIAYPVDYWTRPDQAFTISFSLNPSGRLDRLSLGVKAWVGLVAYYLTGKTSEWVPGPGSG